MFDVSKHDFFTFEFCFGKAHGMGAATQPQMVRLRIWAWCGYGYRLCGNGAFVVAGASHILYRPLAPDDRRQCVMKEINIGFRTKTILKSAG